MEKNKKYSRIPLSEIKESPSHGTYLTNSQLTKYSIFAGACLLTPLVFYFYFRIFPPKKALRLTKYSAQSRTCD